MLSELLDFVLNKPKEKHQEVITDAGYKAGGGLVKVKPQTMEYSARFRGQWYKPEWDFDEIQIAESVDSFLGQSIKKKVDRFAVSDWEFVSLNDEALQYVKRRIAESELVSNRPFSLLMTATARDLFRFQNCMWVKARSQDSSSGSVREDITGKELEPVASWYILPFTDIRLKAKTNGDLKKVMQVLPDGTTQEFFPQDIVHFYMYKNPGFSVGSPILFSALDDITLLRRIEENVEELIETNLFPVFHYKIGSDAFPERVGVDGIKETDVVKKTIQYMPAGSVFVSDHRHEITAIGSESKALRIETYLEYFRNRVFAAIGTTPVDMGDGSTSNRSTSNTLSKNMILDVEAVQASMKIFIDFFVIKELLAEGGYDPLDEDNKVEIQFGVVDKEERMAFENQQIQLYTNNLLKESEARKSLGRRPFTEEDRDELFFFKYKEQEMLLRAGGVGTAANEALAASPHSAITPAAVKKEQQFAKQMEATKRAAAAKGRPPSKTNKTSSNRSRPANQRSTRSAPKLNRDVYFEDTAVVVELPDGIEVTESWKAKVLDRYNLLKQHGVTLQSVANSLTYRLQEDNHGS